MYLQIKRMKQLEQEKDILLQGLEAVERARDWYQKQIQAVQDKQKYIGKGFQSPNVRTQGFVHAERKQKSCRLKIVVGLWEISQDEFIPLRF